MRLHEIFLRLEYELRKFLDNKSEYDFIKVLATFCLAYVTKMFHMIIFYSAGATISKLNFNARFKKNRFYY